MLYTMHNIICLLKKYEKSKLLIIVTETDNSKNEKSAQRDANTACWL